METFNDLLMGFSVVFQPEILLYAFAGCFLGTLTGVLPGIGPLAGIALLLPITYGMDATAAIILLAGIFYGAQYGGSITAILANIPGEVSSIITCVDGHEMAKKGRAGPALGITAFGSFIGGTIGTIGLMVLAIPLSNVALKLGPSEFFALMILAFVLLTAISRGSVVKGLIMVTFGYMLSAIGIDPVGGGQRFTFDTTHLKSGLDIAPLAIGLFGLSEVLMTAEGSVKTSIETFKASFRSYFPGRKDWRDSGLPILRGTILGFLIGAIPGGGVLLASFASYAVEKQFSKRPEKFGTGVIEGVAGPETANNAASSGSFVPLFSLGIPSSAVAALFLGALMIHGIQPGPLFISQHSQIFWGVIASMYVGNVMLLILNLPLIPMWVQLLKVPQKILLPLILLFCTVGSYGVNNNILDVLTMAIFGLVGYVLRKLDYEIAPICLAFVLGPMLENAFRQALIISDGSIMQMVTRPITATILSIAVVLLVLVAFRRRGFPEVEWQ